MKKFVDINECSIDVSYWGDHRLILWAPDGSGYHFNIDREVIRSVGMGHNWRIDGTNKLDSTGDPVWIILDDAALWRILKQWNEENPLQDVIRVTVEVEFDIYDGCLDPEEVGDFIEYAVDRAGYALHSTTVREIKELKYSDKEDRFYEV